MQMHSVTKPNEILKTKNMALVGNISSFGHVCPKQSTLVLSIGQQTGTWATDGLKHIFIRKNLPI